MRRLLTPHLSPVDRERLAAMQPIDGWSPTTALRVPSFYSATAETRAPWELGPVFTPPGPPELDSWLAQVVEEAIEPSLPIVDCAHHLWEASVPPSPLETWQITWKGARSPTNDRFLPPDYRRHIAESGHNVIASVIMDSAPPQFPSGLPKHMEPVEAMRWCNELAEQSAAEEPSFRLGAAIIGNIDFLGLGAASSEVLRAHLAAAPERFRGVRVNLHGVSLLRPVPPGVPEIEDPGGEIIRANGIAPPAAAQLYDAPSFREGFANLLVRSFGDGFCNHVS